jgi:hypothetical protein
MPDGVVRFPFVRNIRSSNNAKGSTHTLLVWHMLPTPTCTAVGYHQKLIKNIIVIYGTEVRSSGRMVFIFQQQRSSFIWQVRIVTTRSCLETSVLHSNAILVATRDRACPTPPSDQPKFAWLYLPALPCWRAAIRDASSSR